MKDFGKPEALKDNLSGYWSRRSENCVYKNLRKLKEKGKIFRVGANKICSLFSIIVNIAQNQSNATNFH